jgi:hypothetical protein
MQKETKVTTEKQLQNDKKLQERKLKLERL